MSGPRIILSGGGTGGHVFPAIAIADAIRKERPDSEFLFVGAKGRMEMERVPKAGYKIEGLWISGFQRNLSAQNLSFPFKLISSLAKARSIVKMFKPNVAVGVGGYASGPLLQVAASRRVPTLIQEQNSYPGITNRLLAKKVNTICVAYEGMDRWFPKEKIILTGNPVRKQVVDIADKRAEALEYFGLQPHKPVLLVIGGSLGAKTINEAIKATLPLFSDKGFQLIWQTGKTYADKTADALRDWQGRGMMTTVFIDRMDLAYAAADAVVSRAGAMSVAELCLTAKPAILVPSPNVAEDHQTKNARALSDKHAAILIPDNVAHTDLPAAIEKLLQDASKRQALSKNVKSLALANAAESIATEVLNLIPEK